MLLRRLFGLFILLLSQAAMAEIGHVTLTTTFSKNGKYSIKSVCYDPEHTNWLGKSTVYRGKKALYTINRPFELRETAPIFLTISNDGLTVAYFTDESPNNGKFKNVVIYRRGKLIKYYNQSEFASCKPGGPGFDFFYNTNNKVYHTVNTPGKGMHDVRNAVVDEKELFLYEHMPLNHGDTIYFTDSQKMVTVFDLKRVKILQKVPFDSIYPRIRTYKRGVTIYDYAKFSEEYVHNFQLKGGATKLAEELGKALGLKYIAGATKEIRAEYKVHPLAFTGYLGHNGVFSMDSTDLHPVFPERVFKKFFRKNRFQADVISPKLDKQHFYFWGNYRLANDMAARQEKIDEETAQRECLDYLSSLDSINHVFIPPDMKTCFVELDKMIKLNPSVPAWKLQMYGSLRNLWGLRDGSRLYKYLQSRGINHYSMLETVFQFYDSWLKGNMEAAKEFEQAYPTRL